MESVTDTFKATNSMRTLRKPLFLAALATMVTASFVGPTVHAEMIQFVTTGHFAAAGGGSVLLGPGGLELRFDSGNSNINLAVGASSNISFGQFNTSFTTAVTDKTVTSAFTLSILQVLPSPDLGLQFLGSIGGTVSISASSIVMQFSGPLTITSSDGKVRYQIINADLDELSIPIPGRISVGAPDTNNGLTSVNGRVTLVPEPSAIALLGLGVPAALVLYRRRAKAA